MAQIAARIEDQDAAKFLRFLQFLLCDIEPRDFAVELWDGTRWAPQRSQFHRFTWKINSSEGLRRALTSSNRELALAEGYVRGDFDLVGDIEAVFPLVDYLLQKKWTAREKLHFAGFFASLSPLHISELAHVLPANGKPHSKTRDRQAISYHYDLSNDFYRLWLDRNLLYSSAYFEDPAEDIDTAQLRKLDRICRKLCLEPGERLVDIGCGWGGLIMHAAREFGIYAVGITLSRAQAELAQSRIRSARLSGRCEVHLLDYRDMHQLGTCDKLVSTGMVEHVGEFKLQEYFAQALRVLRPGGLFLSSGIGRAGNRPKPDQPTFTDVHVFPDGELVPIATMLANAEQAGFEVRAVENWREHYGYTTRHWLRRLEDQDSRAREIVGEERYRTWRLYLAGSTYYFQKGWLGLYQTLLTPRPCLGRTSS